MGVDMTEDGCLVQKEKGHVGHFHFSSGIAFFVENVARKGWTLLLYSSFDIDKSTPYPKVSPNSIVVSSTPTVAAYIEKKNYDRISSSFMQKKCVSNKAFI